MHSPLFRFFLIIGLATLLLMAGVASAAGPRAGEFAARRAAARQAQEVNRPGPEGNREALPPRQAEGRPAQAAPALQRPGRMTPEERAALRRQIEGARDLYRKQN